METALPVELFDKIFQNSFTPEQILNVALVCKHWYSIVIGSCTITRHINLMYLFVPQHITLHNIFANPIWKNLRNLNISNCFGDLKSDQIKALGASEPICKNLRRLVANVSRINDETLIGIATHNPRLKRCYLVECDQITDAAVISLASNCSSLRVLDLSGTLITDQSIYALSVLPMLDMLGLNKCKKITDEGLNAISAFPISRLSLLLCSQLTSEGFESFAEKMTTLTMIDFTRTKVTTNAIKQITMKNRGLTDIRLSLCDYIGKPAVESIINSCKKLYRLVIEDHKIPRRKKKLFTSFDNRHFLSSNL